MELYTFIGYTAGTLGVASFIPQVVRSWKSQSMRDLSWGWLILFAAQTLLWVVYGSMLKAAPIIATNVSVLLLLSILIYLKIKNG